jgi:alkanesulfonate monooxygenase
MTVEIIGIVEAKHVSESRGDPGRLTGPGGNSSALVGTPEQVARALMRYREVGVDTVLIHGFDPLGDVVGWGRELIPQIHDLAQTIPVGGSGA